MTDKYARQAEEPLTAVIFRKNPDREGGGIVALFPLVPHDSAGVLCSSFEHAGQHGGADPDGVVRRTVPARPGEYAALRRELESDPYNYRLEVLRRMPPGAAEARRQAIARQRGSLPGRSAK